MVQIQAQIAEDWVRRIWDIGKPQSQHFSFSYLLEKKKPSYSRFFKLFLFSVVDKAQISQTWRFHYQPFVILSCKAKLVWHQIFVFHHLAETEPPFSLGT